MSAKLYVGRVTSHDTTMKELNVSYLKKTAFKAETNQTVQCMYLLCQKKNNESCVEEDDIIHFQVLPLPSLNNNLNFSFLKILKHARMPAFAWC